MNIQPVLPSMLRAAARLPWHRLGVAALIAGSLASASPALAVIEYDPSFSEDGLASVDPSTSTDSARDVAVDKGGRVVLAGLSRLGNLASSIDRLVVTRLLEDGSPDTDFGDAGVVTFLPDTPNTFGGADGRGVIIQPEDQKIVVAGAWNRNDGSGFQALVARFLENGDPDPDFGDAGSVLLDLPGLFHTVAEDVAVTQDGSLLVAGSCNTSGCTKGFVAKLTPEGKLDETWGTDGVFSMSNPVAAGAAITFHAVRALEGTGAVVVGGGEDLIVVRLDADGALDPSLGGDGVATFNRGSVTIGDFEIGTYEDGASFALLEGGAMILCGSSMHPTNNNRDALLLAVDAGGEIDTSFGDDGWVIFPDASKQEACYDVVERPAGDFVAAGLGFRPTQVSGDGSTRSPLAQAFPLQAATGLVALEDGRVVGGGEELVAHPDYRMSAFRLQEKQCEPCGEVNGDCRITAADALAALKMAVGSLTATPGADVNGDGKVTAADALLVLKIAVGQFEPGEACEA